MNIKLNTPPIIVIGMHRSGTTLVSQILSDLGIFMGKDLEQNNESKVFLGLNDFILKTAHAYWDQPLPINNLYGDEVSTQILVKFIKEQVNRKTHLAKFLGYRGIFANKKQLNWGWKDPRNTITLPVWKSVFPEAKIIYVYRNGIDVANSLYKRENKVKGGINLPHYSCRCLDLERAFKLWEEYNQFYFKQRLDINPANLLEIKYEDLLQNSENKVQTLAKFVNAKISSKQSDSISIGINKTRAYSFKNNHELMVFYNKIKELETMKNLGYIDL